jgi:hypothetical protein
LHALKTNEAGSIATDDPSRFWRYRCSYRNELYVYRREGIYGILLYTLRMALHLFRIWRHGRDHRLKRTHTVLSSAIAGLRFNPPIEFPCAHHTDNEQKV